MTYAQLLLPEFDHEMASTRKVLERIPADKFDWQAHPKSHTMGWNANHVADIVSWLVMALNEPAFDVAPPGGTPHQTPKLTTPDAVLALFDRNVIRARQAIENVKDETLNDPWSLKRGDHVIFTMPRAAVARTMVLNHLMHHRSILLVYLRLNHIPVPGMYGPSGDER